MSRNVTSWGLITIPQMRQTTTHKQAGSWANIKKGYIVLYSFMDRNRKCHINPWMSVQTSKMKYSLGAWWPTSALTPDASWPVEIINKLMRTDIGDIVILDRRVRPGASQLWGYWSQYLNTYTRPVTCHHLAAASPDSSNLINEIKCV